MCKCVCVCVAELSESGGSDSSVIVVSDSDESVDEVELCLTSVERRASEQARCHAADEYAAAVAAVFLNTTSKTSQINSNGHDSGVRMLLADAPNKDTAVDCNSSDGNMTEFTGTLNDLATEASSVPSSAECVTSTGAQNDSDLEPVKFAHTDLHLASRAMELDEEMRLSDCIAVELADALDSSELNDCLDPVELLSLDTGCETFNDVCNSSFLGNLSFIDECLINEDCASSQLLACSTADSDALKDDVQQMITNQSQSDNLNNCSSDHSNIVSELIHSVERSTHDLIEMSSVADDNSDDACCQQSLPLCSISSNVIALVDSKLASCVDSSCQFTPVSASFDTSSSQADEYLTSESHQAAAVSSTMTPVHVDLNDNELCTKPTLYTDCLASSDDSELCTKPTLYTDCLASSDDLLLMHSSHVTVASSVTQASCNMLATHADVGQCENLLPVRTHKRLLSDECSNMACKRFRVDSDCLDEELSTAFNSSTGICETVMNNSDTNVVSAADDVSSTDSDDVLKSNLSQLQSVCCCSCQLQCDVSSVSYCTDGHACCIACLQQQVKSLLSSPSKARMLSLLFTLILNLSSS